MVAGVTPEQLQAAREELDAVLSSKLLTRSKNLVKIAEYVGRSYLEGNAARLKEYSIAVEALGRSPDFDPKKDSIVRVEAVRLRRKLREYYETEGQDHELRFVLEPGQYAPRFVSRAPVANAPVSRPSEPEPIPSPAMEPRAAVDDFRSTSSRSSRPRIAITLGAALTVLLVAAGIMRPVVRAHFDPRPQEIRFMAGINFGPLVSQAGEIWSSEPPFWRGGSSAIGFEFKSDSRYAELPFDGQRQGDFEYAVPAARNPWELRLYFAPRLDPATNNAAAVTSRRFDVFVNDRAILKASDAFAVQSLDRLVVRAFRDIYPQSDGKIHIRFRSGADTAYVNGIRLTPGVVGRPAPIRIVAKLSPYTDPFGLLWSADSWATGGDLVTRSDRVAGGADPNIYSGERFGAFRYDLPAPDGTYTLRLHFAETWWSPNYAGGGAGKRLFDVTANGRVLLSNFDVYREAGGSYRALVKTFRGIHPGADGYVHLAFTPRKNQAMVNAIELEGER